MPFGPGVAPGGAALGGTDGHKESGPRFRKGGGGSQHPALPHNTVSPEGTVACRLTRGCASAAEAFPAVFSLKSRRHGSEQ